MKKKALLFLPGVVALIFAASPLIPSFNQAAVAQSTHGGNWASQLNLTPEKQSQVENIQQAARQQMESIRSDSSLTQEQKRAQMTTVRQNADQQLQTVLSPTQWQQLQQMRAARRQKWQQHHQQQNQQQ